MSKLNFKEILLFLFTSIFIFSFICIIKIILFDNVNLFYNMNPFIIIIGILVLLFLLYTLNKFFNNLEDKKLKKIRRNCFIGILVLQIIFAVFLHVNPTWDFRSVNQSAIELALYNKPLGEYFYVSYPNNIAITLLLSCMYKFIGMYTDNIHTFYTFGTLLNIFMINISILILSKFIKKVFGICKETLFSVFALLITPFYAYSQIVYTDTITMFFPITMFLFLYNYINSKSKVRFRYLIYIGILACIGTALKTNVIISLIAIVIYLFFLNKIKPSIKCISLIIIPFIIGTMFFQYMVTYFIPVTYKEAGLPYTHWMMMGLEKPYGSFSHEDVQFSLKQRSLNGKEGTKKANIKIIKQRLKSYGVEGYLRFLKNKISFTWGDGTYYSLSKLSREAVFKGSIFYEHVVGKKNGVFVSVSQFSHILILIMIVVSSIRFYKYPKEFTSSLNICIFGVFLFLIIWETRSRYLLCYLPILILSAFFGLDYILEVLEKSANKIKSYFNGLFKN
ncbi:MULTISPECIES: glycosyltransferase family 39 protein [unclassified Clostridioides]|uniref:glycosyltransferase family 39 protein n=1 Tax=unclassified Clostridioides TaxID=2635829 RepID=UPI001D0F70C0|nr:glycosyltransferase family 39 protein [Clostridioides sp. ES-S-0171-01]MCC0688965.1 glycosyltransferase family 39 protein [Clostridioides sp. ES-S-0056-01]